ncbi:hypothetical protein CVT24_005401 [Panaeolus cyanescens]|uniref:EXPERA domain-containing protein n=1 Tax=Panaeolus cyanescens TaxID=181874 RepID=A0A409Y908_9AGAR|nr:hypothetical protein CVT24_005401 [Panaeolus cyanescens]
MAVKTHTWISLWFLFAAPVILWDIGYCFMRPRSMKGGDLHWFWKPYAWYQEVDYVYGMPAVIEGDGFPNAQALLNLIETTMNISYLYLAYIAQWPSAPLIGFGAALMTCSKTVLYWSQELYCGYCAIGHNDFWTIFALWIVPNSLWTLIPFFIACQLGKDMAQTLNLAAKKQTKLTNGKTL